MVATTVSCPCVAGSLVGFLLLVSVPTAMIVIAAIVQARRSARRGPPDDLPPKSTPADADSDDSLRLESGATTRRHS